MDIRKHFLQIDIGDAVKELRRVDDCLKQVTLNVNKGNLEKAKDRSVDLLTSLSNLTKMAEEKTKIDRMDALIPGMPTAVHIEIMRSVANE